MYKKIVSISIALLATIATYAANDNGLKYTKENPLVYEDVWDLPPFAYMSNDGVPKGFNIDLVKEILKRLDVPYVIKLKHTPLNFHDVGTGEAAFTIGMKAPYHDQYGLYGSNALILFTHSIATPKSAPIEIRNFDDLKNYRVYVHRGSFSHNQMIDEGLEANAIPVDDIKSIMIQVSEQDSGIIFWNTNTMKELVVQNDIDNLKLTPISMKYGEYHFISRDSILLQKLDSVYDDMVSKDEVMPLRKKWFYSDMGDDTAKSFTKYTTIAFGLFFLIILAYNIYYRIQRHRLNESNKRQAKRLELLLKTGKMNLWTYDIRTKTFRLINPEAKTNDEYSQKTFSLFFPYTDFKRIKDEIENIEMGLYRQNKILVMSNLNRDSENEAMSYFDLNISILHEENNVPTMLIGTMNDVTAERKTFIETQSNLLKYRTVFNSSMADLAYFDKDGILTDINQNACITFDIKDRNELIKSKTHISDIPVFDGLGDDIYNNIHVSSITNMDKIHINKESTKIWGRTGILYYEFTIIPIIDTNGTPLCYMTCGRDVTEIAKRMNKEKMRQKRINNTSEEVKDYINNINYALEVSGTRLANYYPDTHEMEISNDTNNAMVKLSQVRCVTLIEKEYREKAEKLMINLDKKTVKNFALRVGTIFGNKRKDEAYYEFNGIPIENNETHQTSHYFCLCRNISQIIETEKQLEEETKRAQEAEEFQNSFLKNMSHEIRTPLYTVVGFAELFQAEHDVEDEPVFIDQIKQNTDTLLRLVNDILLLSRIDAKMVDISTTTIDFPEFFKAKCLMGWTQGIASGVKTNVETSDEHLFVEIDDNHTGLIIETLCRLASKFTEKGHIHTKYIYHSGMITMIFKDSGIGLDEKKKTEIKNRDLNTESGDYGTLIQIVICQQLALLMGGSMDFEGDPNKGSTFRVTIPCKLIEVKDEQVADNTETSALALDNNMLDIANLSEEEINSLLANNDLFK